jgi:hypothetical protein
VARLAVAFTLLFAALQLAGAAHAQEEPRPSSLLGSPSGEDEVSTDALEIPEPPGSHLSADDEVRYPLPGQSSLAATREARDDEDDEPRVRIPSRVTTRLRSLDANLQGLAARGGGNVVNAVLSLLTGGLAITLGALYSPNDGPMSIYLYVYGGAAATRGVLDFVLTPNASGAAITYQHMPMGTHAEVRERLDFGERALSGLAEQALIQRILDASLNMAAGVAVVPIYLAPNGFEIVDPLEYFVLIGAGVSIISGIITLASTSAAEQAWGAYQQLRDRLREERELERRGDNDADDGRTPEEAEELEAADEALLDALRPAQMDLRFGGAPLPGGAYAGVTLRF